MSTFILLDLDQAGMVRGPSVPFAALNPIEREGGVFVLGVEVLNDPAHQKHWAFLTLLPQMDSADPAFPPPLAE